MIKFYQNKLYKNNIKKILNNIKYFKNKNLNLKNFLSNNKFFF